MTRIAKMAHWPLQDAKARFSELVRKVKSDGPQIVTVHGRDEVVVVSAETYHRLTSGRTGQDLIDAFAAGPHKDVEFADVRVKSPVRKFEF